MKYRKKPIVIEAIQWTGKNFEKLQEFTNDTIYHDHRAFLFISTLEGDMEASLGDYVIKGIQGEFYPCKEDIFWNTYDKVE